MKKLSLILSVILVAFLIASCSSFSGGLGYGVNNYDLTIKADSDPNKTEEFEGAISGLSLTMMELFNFNSQNYGFNLYSDFGFMFDNKTNQLGNESYGIHNSIGPSWLLKTTDKSRLLIGGGPFFSYGINVKPTDNEYDISYLDAFIQIGPELLADFRYHISEKVFVSLKGVLRYSVPFSFDVNAEGSTRTVSSGSGLGYNVYLTLGRNTDR